MNYFNQSNDMHNFKSYLKLLNVPILKLFTLLLVLFSLGACGGGAGSNAVPPSTVNPSNPTTPSVQVPTLTLDVSSATTSTAVHTMQAGASITATVTLKDAKGMALPNTLVNFRLSNDISLVVMNPNSGNVITDTNGVASVLITANAPSVGGVFQITASATLSTTIPLTSNSWAVSVGAANAVLGTPLLDSSTPNPLPANSSTTIRVPVTSLGVGVASLPASAFTASSICASQKPALASLDVIGATNGVAVFNYKNLGCTTTPDIISISLTGSATPATISVPVSTAATSELRYISVVPSASLVVKGAGGLGRQEAGTLSFKLLNTAGNGVAGATVNFSLSTIAGGIALSAASGVTDPNGIVSVILYSGKLPTPVSILATTTDPVLGIKLSSTSSVLAISAGPPEQRSFSLSLATSNIRGHDIDGTTTDVVARLSDFWGNSVTDGTVVSMIAEGANISNATDGSGSCATVNGVCKMVFTTQDFRPIDRRVSITAFATGVESFNDANGNGIFDSSENCSHLGAPFIDNNENGIRDVNETLITNIAPSSDAIKLAAPCAVRNSTYVYGQSIIVMSGKAASADTIPAILKFNKCSPLAIDFLVKDINGNAVPAGSSVAIQDLKNATASQVYPSSVPNTTAFGSVHRVFFTPDEKLCTLPTPNSALAPFTLVVTSGLDAVPFFFIINY